MKKSIVFILTLIMISGLFAALPVGTAKVEIYYFHFTRRCATCLNVEKVSRESVEALFPEKVKKGDITFKSVNLDEKEGEAIGVKYKIEGQTLIVISGEKQFNLTDKGFLYANNNPEKLKEEIRKAIEEALK
jgi:hypothetical protein